MSARPVKSLAATVFASLALGAWAQQPAKPGAAAPKAPAAASQGRDAFKGKLKPGLYEVTMESDMSGVPGIPKEHAKQTQKRQQCITQQEVDKGIEADPNCPASSIASSGNQISIAASCKDGARTETKMTFRPDGYTAEMKATNQHQGKPVTSTLKVTSKYIGPCK